MSLIEFTCQIEQLFNKFGANYEDESCWYYGWRYGQSR